MQTLSSCGYSDIPTKHASFYHIHIMSILFQYHALKLKLFAGGVKSVKSGEGSLQVEGKVKQRKQNAKN